MTLVNTELETFNELIPKYPTNLSISIPSRGINRSGSFKEAMINFENLDASLGYNVSDYYSKPDAVIAMYCERNIDSIKNLEMHTSLFDFR